MYQPHAAQPRDSNPQIGSHTPSATDHQPHFTSRTIPRSPVAVHSTLQSGSSSGPEQSVVRQPKKSPQPYSAARNFALTQTHGLLFEPSPPPALAPRSLPLRLSECILHCAQLFLPSVQWLLNAFSPPPPAPALSLVTFSQSPISPPPNSAHWSEMPPVQRRLSSRGIHQVYRAN